MSTFKYKAIDRAGISVKGQIEATSEDAAIERLKARRLSVFKITEQSPQIEIFSRNRKAKPKDMARYIRQLATLLNAGVTLLDALASLSKSNAHPLLAEASKNIRMDLRAGERLSSAMEKHLPKLPRYVPRLAELGEETGKSAKALTDAAERMEFEDDMRSDIRSALAYPVFLTVVGSIIVFLLFLFVVPKFDELIGDNKENLPFMSRFVINLGSGLRENLIPTLIVMGALVAGGTYIATNEKLRSAFRTRLEDLPIIGPVLIQADLGGWARTVGIALDNGADMLSALKLGEYGMRSARLKRELETSRREIRAGRNIDEVLEENVPDFDPLTIDIVRTGRTSGGLANMLLFVGDTQEKETRTLAKQLTSLAEPIAILTISAIVGTIVISIVLAMTSLYDFAL